MNLWIISQINGLPTLILYKQKKIVNVEHGGRPLSSLISLVSEHLGTETKEVSEEAVSREEENTNTKDEL